jgi:hypothetical protein
MPDPIPLEDAMAEPRFGGDDDLPRTLRRAREERDRELRDREASSPPPWTGPSPDDMPPHYDMRGSAPMPMARPPGPVAVDRLQIPFLHLAGFFLKAVIAAIPALILLTMLLFAGGQVLKAFFPGLRHFEIVVRSPDGAPAPAPAPTAPAEASKPTPGKK